MTIRGIRPEQLSSGQSAALAALAAGQSVIIEAPARSGKTTLALEAALRAGQGRLGAAGGACPDAREGLAAGLQAPVIVVPTRARRALLEDSAWLPLLRGTHPIHTPAALAFAICNRWRTKRAEPLPPLTLRTGADEDALLADLIAATPGAPFPPEVLDTEALRLEARNLLARCGDFGVTPDRLRAWGREVGLPAWQWAADVLQAYQAPALTVDSARSQDLAAELLATWDQDREAAGVGVPRPSYPLVIVDDVQDMTGATVRLLAALHAAGSQLLILSAQNVAVDVHRGALPHAAQQLAEALDGPVTRLRWGPDEAVATPRPPVDVHLYASSFDEGAGIAGQLQRLHLFEGVPYAEMAVIVRARQSLAPLAGALRAAGVRVDATAQRFAPMRQPLVRALIDLVTEAPALTGEDEAARREACERILGGVLVSIDPLDLVRLARRVRAEAGATSLYDTPGSADLVDLVAHPEAAAVLAQAYATDLLAPTAAKVALAADLAERARQVGDHTPLEGLWQLWKAAGCADTWCDQALRGSQSAHEHLDAALALFRLADFWMQRHPGLPLKDFADYVSRLDVPLDTVAPEGQRAGGVALLTPSQAAGRTYRVVVVAALSEGQWPNLTIRDTALRSDLLVDLATGRCAGTVSRDLQVARDATARDERRMFDLAASRATERLILTSPSDADHAPSRYLIAAWRAGTGRGTDPTQTLPALSLPEHPLSARGLAAELRRRLLLSHRLVDALALLGAAGEAAALPSTWTGLAGTPAERARWFTSTHPVYPPSRHLGLSPSKVGQLMTCPLRWILTSQGGQTPVDSHRAIGLAIHTLAEEYQPDLTLADMHERAEELWQDLGPTDGYQAALEKQRFDARVEALYTFLSARHAPADVEHRVSQKLAGDRRATISGSIDRLEYGDDGPHVYDFKTSSSVPSVPEAAVNPQMLAYQAAVAGGGHVPSGATLVYLTGERSASGVAKLTRRKQDGLAAAGPKDLPDWAAGCDPEAVAQPGGMGVLAEHLLATSCERARSATFPAYPNPGCGMCPVHTSCPLQPRGERSLP